MSRENKLSMLGEMSIVKWRDIGKNFHGKYFKTFDITGFLNIANYFIFLCQNSS